jgi:hypothetical protein
MLAGGREEVGFKCVFNAAVNPDCENPPRALPAYHHLRMC